MREPAFWHRPPSWQSRLLSPLSMLYGAIAARRMAQTGIDAGLPVICVGNFHVGGAGKTPTVLALSALLRELGERPVVLSRGYGGSMDRTTIVDPSHHRARDVGDEPLLIAREALTVISRNRIDGARRLVEEGCDLIIMDDGFQSAKLHIDYALMVIDTVRGIGNGFIVPAGPVRAPTRLQLQFATALLKVGRGTAADPFIRIAARSGKPVMEALIRPVGAPDIGAGKLLAFAGIADPGKFYATLAELGGEVAERRSFGDHHHFTDDEIDDIINAAEREGLTIVTTAKDAVRLMGHHGKAAELLERSKVIEVEMAFDSPAMPGLIIDQAIASARKRGAKKSA